MIKNIIFDLGGVIINGKRTLSKGELNLSDSQINKINNKFFSLVSKLDKEKGTLEEAYNKSGLDLDTNTKDYIIHYYKHKTYNEDLLKLKDKLSHKYDIYILTNMNNEAISYLKQIHIFDNTKGYVVSQDYGITKPDERIYQILCDKYNIIPKECLFIDDKKENVETSKNIGMNGYIYDNNEGLISYLNKLNIEV